MEKNKKRLAGLCVCDCPYRTNFGWVDPKDWYLVLSALGVESGCRGPASGDSGEAMHLESMLGTIRDIISTLYLCRRTQTSIPQVQHVLNTIQTRSTAYSSLSG